MKQCHCAPRRQSSSMGRRHFIRLAALGGGFSLFHGAAAFHGGTAEALLLTCMDYRMVEHQVNYMNGRGLKDQYDHLALAGGSAGAACDRFKAWHETFWSHLQVAIELHKISRVIIIDHRDCDAFRLAVGDENMKDGYTELVAHAAILMPFANAIRKKYPSLKVETLLMALDGKVEEVNLS